MMKIGDDLRQDQLILQMIQLMDTILKRVNLDLKLSPYAALAVSRTNGMLEFLSDRYATWTAGGIVECVCVRKCSCQCWRIVM